MFYSLDSGLKYTGPLSPGSLTAYTVEVRLQIQNLWP